jgi:hypothetical protein
MPRGNPKQVFAIRLEQAVIDEIKDRAGARQASAVIEAVILDWLKRQRRKADPLAKHLAPPTARERAVRRQA